jgi:hypothetical protein
LGGRDVDHTYQIKLDCSTSVKHTINHQNETRFRVTVIATTLALTIGQGSSGEKGPFELIYKPQPVLLNKVCQNLFQFINKQNQFQLKEALGIPSGRRTLLDMQSM